MKKRFAFLATSILLVASGLTPLAARAAGEDLTAHVDPFIGTLGGGFAFPGAAAPYGMVQLSPDTDGYFAYTGYQWGDAFIRGFSHVHIESMGVHAGGDLPFMPTIGAVRSDPNLFKSPFVHALEEASPGYYKVLLAGSGTTVELTTGVRAGMHRYTFPPVPKANVILDIGHTAAGADLGPSGVVPGVQEASLAFVDDTTVVGTEENGDDHYTVHFAARFNRPFASFGGWNANGGAPVAGAQSVAGEGAGGFVTFDATQDRTVLIKVGISFVSRENALANLDAEIPGDAFPFDDLRARTRTAWNDALHAIEVDGGTALDKRVFYTALYHAQHHPNVFSDADGSYMGNDGATHVAQGFTYYTNFSLWDTYRTENQLLALIAPDRFRDMMTSMRRIAEEGGRLPRWNLMNQYADFMNGEPAIPAIVDGFCRGVVAPQDIEPLYDAMRALALDPARHRDPVYLAAGFVPYDFVNSGASSTLEHAIADFALALMADRLGKTADRDALLALAANYRNVVDPSIGFARPRLSDWSWLRPYHPELPDGFREGTGWQYTWLVPHDVHGLADMLGGAGPTRRKLDTFFSAPLAENVPFVVPEVQRDLSLFGIAYYGNQYSPDNEHDLQAPFLYNYVGQPWKTQAIVRNLQSVYRPTPDGLPGNDDLGTMSAWYIWSALGFYPETAGAPLYVVASPVFSEARIRLPGGTFTVKAPGASLLGKYVRSASLNGGSLEKSWFTHEAITPGGSIELRMGPVANRSWAAGPDAAPPSMSVNELADFGCG